MLTPNANDDQLDYFGTSVALDGPLAAVGARDYGDDGDGSYGGTVLYALQGGAWIASGLGGDARTLAISEPYVAIGGGRGRGITQVFENTGSAWTGVQLSAEPGSGSRASMGSLGLSDERLVRNSDYGVRAWEHMAQGWTRVGELPLSTGVQQLDVRGGRIAAASSSSVMLYRTDASGLGWAGPVTLGGVSGCEPKVTPTFVVCLFPFQRTLRIFDTRSLADPPDTPVLIVPTDGGTVGREVTFEWEPVNDATSYVLRYSVHPDLIVPNGTAPGEVTVSTPTATVPGLSPTKTYYWHVRAVRNTESSAWSRTRSLHVIAGHEDEPSEEPSEEPSGEAMLVVAPNPSAATARATLVLPSASRVSLRVFDARGRIVAVLDESAVAAGPHEYALPEALPSGRYVVRAEVEPDAGDERVLTVPFVVAR